MSAGMRGPLDEQPDEPGWWIASDGKWYAPELAPPTTTPSEDVSAPTPIDTELETPKKSGWLKRNTVAVAVGLVALLLGMGIGAAANSQQNKVDKQADQIKTLSDDNEALQKQVDDRSAQQAADEAHARSVAADRQASKDRAADARKAAAAKVAADKKAAAAEKVAAAKKAAADKKAAAAKKAAADKKAADEKSKADAEAFAAAQANEAKKNTFDGDGVREIGVDINPGRWKTDGSGEQCYYAILNSSDTSNIADNNITTGPATVDLRAGQFFETTRCGAWTRVG